MVRRNSSGAPVDQACGLHAVGYCTGYRVCGPVVAAERLGQPAVEELGGVQHAGGDPGGLLLVPVAGAVPRR